MHYNNVVDAAILRQYDRPHHSNVLVSFSSVAEVWPNNTQR